EATLSFLRDLAYSTDPEILDYLSTHRIVFVPNANPDGTPGRTRRNANGVDINRDGFALTQPEALTLQHLIRDTGALLVTDGHEQVGTPSEEMQYLRPELDSIYQGIAARGDDLVATLQAAFTSSSISHGPYPNPGRVSFRETVSMHHALGLLLESYTNAPRMERHVWHQVALEAVRGWHARESWSLVSMAEASRQYQSTTTEPYQLQTGMTNYP